jgi:hypothetical protein
MNQKETATKQKNIIAPLFHLQGETWKKKLNKTLGKCFSCEPHPTKSRELLNFDNNYINWICSLRKYMGFYLQFLSIFQCLLFIIQIFSANFNIFS